MKNLFAIAALAMSVNAFKVNTDSDTDPLRSSLEPKPEPAPPAPYEPWQSGMDG